MLGNTTEILWHCHCCNHRCRSAPAGRQVRPRYVFSRVIAAILLSYGMHCVKASVRIGEVWAIGVEHQIENALCHPMIAFWFRQLTAERRVLYRPRWLANGQCAACKGQANSKQIARSGRQSILTGHPFRQ